MFRSVILLELIFVYVFRLGTRFIFDLLFILEIIKNVLKTPFFTHFSKISLCYKSGDRLCVFLDPVFCFAGESVCPHVTVTWS